MDEFQYVKPSHIVLKQHPDYTEQWLEQRIAEDPTILGLGELDLIERQRAQERAGRLDLLLADVEQNTRYEVELMLGPTDESHIMRTIEYWDIERRRYPAYDHIAVLVAEDITARFLNLLTLFSGTIPLVAIQLNALQVDDKIVLDFVKVIDQRALRTDDTDIATVTPADRSYWNEHAAPETVKLVDELIEILNEKTEATYQPKYNRYYIGLTDGTRVNNLVYFEPRKKYVLATVKVGDGDAWRQKLEDIGLWADVDRNGLVRMRISSPELKKNREVIAEFLHAAAESQ